jgi:glucose/arabinose dehydrogenase
MSAQKSLMTVLATAAMVMALWSCGKKAEHEGKDQDTTQQAAQDSAKVYQQVVSLPAPDEKATTKKYSKVIGWPEGKMPQVPAGFVISKFATGLKSPRNMIVAPNGDIFVALANTESKGVKKVADKLTGRDKSQHTTGSLNQVVLLRDKDGDGTPEIKSVYLSGLNQPFGMLVLHEFFYVANTDGVWRYAYNENETRQTGNGQKILELPAGGYNNHWTRNLLASKDGSKIYISVGSASNVAEHGMDEEKERANIIEINPDGTGKRIYASGLRNPVGMAWAPGTDELWTVVNERDNLGDDLVPDYLTHVQPDGFYGWPYAYFGQNLDPRIKEKEQRPDLTQRAITPDLALDSHSASLGLIFYENKDLPAKYHGGALIAQHGSWNRTVFTGYRVAFVPFRNGKLDGPAEDFITGFIADDTKGEVYGRPVAAAVTKEGYVLVTDDASDVIWLVRTEKQNRQ